MVYLHVTIQCQRGKLGEWTKNFEQRLPILKKNGENLVGAWRTTFGVYDEITHIYAFESLAEMERARKATIKNPKFVALAEAAAPLVHHEYSKLMEALPYWPVK